MQRAQYTIPPWKYQFTRLSLWHPINTQTHRFQIQLYVHGPVDLILLDPSGNQITAGAPYTLIFQYLTQHIPSNGMQGQSMSEAPGDYQIRLIGKSCGNFTLGVITIRNGKVHPLFIGGIVDLGSILTYKLNVSPEGSGVLAPILFWYYLPTSL